MSAKINLEQAFEDAIQQIVQTDADKQECLEYFERMTVNDLIEEALTD